MWCSMKDTFWTSVSDSEEEIVIINANMNNARVQPSSWGSSSHDQKAVPVSSPLVNTHNGDKSRKRTNMEEPHEKAKKPKIELIDVETDAPINQPEDTKENINIDASISSSISNADISIEDQPKNRSILLKLAILLVNNKMTLIGLMKKFHVSLVKENVLVVKQKKESNVKKYYGKLHQNFVKDVELSDSAQKLKYYLEKCLQKKLGLDTNEKPDLDRITLNLTEKFGRKFQLDNNPKIERDELRKLVKELKPNILFSLRTMGKEQQLIRNNPVFKKHKNKLAGHVFKKIKGRLFVFTPNFLNRKTKLKGNLDELRKRIIKKVERNGFNFSDLKKCQFEICDFTDTETPDVEMKLPQEDFIEHFDNFTNEVQNATKKKQYTSVKETYNISDNVINDGFSDIKITFNQEARVTITSCLTNISNKQVNFIDTSYPLFHFLKVTQIVQDIPMYLNGWIQRKFNDFLCNSNSIIEEFESTSIHLLLIMYSGSSEKIEGMDKICWKLEDIVQKTSENNPKKLVVIGDTKDLHALFKFKCNTIDENCVNILSQLTEKSQSELSQKIQVNLYDRQSKLAELMNIKQALVNIVSTPQLFEQLLIEDFVIDCSEHQQKQSYYKSEFIQEETFLSQNRLVILSGESGTGKSTCLQKLEDRLIKSSARTWVVGIHLDKIDVIKKLEEQSFKESKIDFLIELLGYQGLQRQMFTACVAGELNLKLVLLVYGFGERLLYSSEDSKKAVIDILKTLQSASGNINIFVTFESQSRTETDRILTELKRELNAPAFELDPFTSQKKLEFMVKCLRSYPDSNKVDLSKHADNLLQSYKDKKLDCLVDTPLKIKMLVHINLSELMSDNPSPTYDIPGDLYEFYERFIKKCNLDDTVSQILDRLSLGRLLTSSERKRLDVDELQPLYKEEMVENQNNLLMHLTFAENSVARWLCSNIHNKKIKSAILQCIERLIAVTSSVFFYTIVNCFEAYNKKKCLRLARDIIKKNFVNWFRAVLQRGFLDQVYTQMLLRYAVKKDKLEIVKILIDHYRNHYRHSNEDFIKFINSKSDKNKNALTVAEEAKYNSSGMACVLIAAGAEVKGLKSEFQKKVLRFALDEFCKGQSHCDEYISIVKKFILHESQVVIESLEPDRKFKQLFTYFLDNGSMNVVKCLLEILHIGTNVKPQLLFTSFDVINANRNIKDEDRLEMSKVLLDKLDGSLKEHTNLVIEAALDSSHLESFEYFVNAYPTAGYNDFLKDVLLHNRFKVLEFLKKYNDKLSKQLSLSGVTALNLALAQSNVNPRILRLLLDQCDLNNVNKQEAVNLLCTALERNLNPRLVRYLVEKLGNILNTEGMHGMFPWCYVLLGEKCRYSAKDQSDLMEYFLSKTNLKVPSNKVHYDKRWQEIKRKLDFFRLNKRYTLNYDDDSMPRLHKAVQANDVGWLTFLLIHGADVDMRERESNRSALHLAVKNGHRDMVQLLLRYGSMFDARDENGKIPLNFAREQPDIEHMLKKVEDFFGNNLSAMLEKEVEFLDYTSADSFHSCQFRHFFNCRNYRGQTLLHAAAKANDSKAISILMKFSRMCEKFYPDQPSLDINAQDLEGNTPLLIACRKVGYREVVTELFNHGAIFDIKNTNKKSLRDLFGYVLNIFKADKRNEYETAESCIKKNPLILNVKDRNGMTIVHWIVQQKADDLLKFLFNLDKKEVYFSAVDREGRTMLHAAVEADNLLAAKLSLKLGIRLDVKDFKGRRAFECGRPDYKCVKMLRGIYKLFEDLHSDEPKILVDEHPDNLRRYLRSLEKSYEIEPYVVVNAKTSPDYWNSLAHQAAIYNYHGVLENLFRHGAVLPCKFNYIGDCKNLIYKVEKVFENLSVDVWSESRLDEKIIVNCRNSDGETLLYKAIKEKKFQEIEWLEKRGATYTLDANINI